MTFIVVIRENDQRDAHFFINLFQLNYPLHIWNILLFIIRKLQHVTVLSTVGSCNTMVSIIL
jgi:hypothetical protein